MISLTNSPTIKLIKRKIKNKTIKIILQKKFKNNKILLLFSVKTDPANFHHGQLQTPDGQSVLELKNIHRTVLMSDTSYSDFMQPSFRLQSELRQFLKALFGSNAAHLYVTTIVSYV